MKNTSKRFIWIAVNIILLVSICLIGEFFPQTQQVLSIVMRVYVVLACTVLVLFFSPRRYSQGFTCAKIISILWTIIGILLITLFLINAFSNIPLLFVYILLSPIIAILTYCGQLKNLLQIAIRMYTVTYMILSAVFYGLFQHLYRCFITMDHLTGKQLLA